MKFKYILRRVNAFLIDYIFLSFVTGLIIPMVIPYDNSEVYQMQLLELVASGSTDYNEIFSLFELVSANYGKIYFVVVVANILYYVILAKALKDRTLGCFITGQKIIKMNKTPVTLSDLTVKMFLTNGTIIPLTFALSFIFINDAIAAALVSAFVGFGVLCFLVINFIFLVTSGKSLVDIITKTRPVIVLRIPGEQKKF